MNLRPLGYEPNELPDCSTPRPMNCSHSINCPEACQRSIRIKHLACEPKRMT